MSFWKMMRGTEPTFAGMRTPRQFVEDDARLTRLVNPQERYRSLQEIVPQGTRSSDSKDALEASAQDLMATQERRDKLKGAVGGLGSILAGAFQQEPQRQLQFAPVNMGENVPIIDPRYMRYAGRRKSGGEVPENSYVDVDTDEQVVHKNGRVFVLPKGQTIDDNIKSDEPKIQTLGGTIEVPIEEPQESFKSPQKEDTSHNIGMPQEMEEPIKEQSIADVLRGQMGDIQTRLATGYKKTNGKNYDRKRNWKDSLRSAGYGLLQSLATAPPTNDLGSLLGRAIGGAGTGAVLGATMDNVDEKMRDRLKLAQLMPQYEQAYGMERQKKADERQTRIADAQIGAYESKRARDLAYAEQVKAQAEANAKRLADAPKVALEKRMGKWKGEVQKLTNERNKATAKIEVLNTTIAEATANKTRLEGELKKAVRPADRNRIKGQIERYNQAISKAKSDMAGLNTYKNSLIDPKQPTLEDNTDEVESIDSDLMQSIVKQAPPGATPEQIQEKYRWAALTLKNK